MRIRARRAVLALTAAAVAMLFFLPVVWVIGGSLRPELEIFGDVSPLSVHTFLPDHWTLHSFWRITHESQFVRATLNSIGTAAAVVIVGLALSTLAAFALSALEFPGRELLFAVVVISFLVPFDAVAVPLATIFRRWGLANSYTGIALPMVANGLSIFVLRQFFIAVPRQIKEAARIDGAGWLTILFRIYVPLARPALISAGILLFLSQWQAYLWPLLIAPDPDHQLGQVSLTTFSSFLGTDYGPQFAGALILTAIPSAALLFLQRYFVQSLSSTGSTG